MCRGEVDRPSNTVDNEVVTELTQRTAVEQRELLETKGVSARELLDAHLKRIGEVNQSVNAIVALDGEVAEKQAALIDEMLAQGQDPGPLAGLVTAHKDLEETKDFPTTFGSPIFANYQPSADSLLVDRMRRAGAVAVGKTNVPEFGAGSHSFNPVYGTTLNPYDLSRSAGGSSGGAGAALAANMVAVADGSDMGGSLRNPAAWNNVVGFRNSPRIVPSADGDWSILGVKGAMARTVDDLVMLLRVIGQPHAGDPLSRPLVLPTSITAPSRPLRVAFSADLGGLPVEGDVRLVLDQLRTDVEEMGWHVTDAEPSFAGADECFQTLRARAFAAGPFAHTPERLAMSKETVQDEVRRGRAFGVEDVANASQHLATLWRRAATFFEDYDLLLAPVSQLSPFPADEEFPRVVSGQTSDHYTNWMRACCRVTTMGMPALSLPAGFTQAGLPVGVQLIGGPWNDLGVLQAAKAIESVTGHWKRRPSL